MPMQSPSFLPLDQAPVAPPRGAPSGADAAIRPSPHWFEEMGLPPAPGASAAVLEAMLDEVDYPMLLVLPGLRVLRANKAAHRALGPAVAGDVPGAVPGAAADRPLLLARGRLHGSRANRLEPLEQAVEAACRRRTRAMVEVGVDRRMLAISVVPQALDDGERAALLIVAKPRPCEELSLHGYARLHSLSDTEARVLSALCQGFAPRAIAGRHGVALSTIRTQIGSLRVKTGAADIGDLVRKVFALPPLVNSLSCAG